jgi:putative membrane protein insertion efficiency factor
MLLVRLYRWTLAPAKMFLFGPLGHCRFTPSCSQFALEAIRVHGATVGGWLAMKRICRCHPWGGCGHDPVPDKTYPQISSFKFQMMKSGVGSAPSPLRTPPKFRLSGRH